MYKHLKKMTIAVIIWAVIACICIMPSVVLWGFSIFGDFDDLKEGICAQLFTLPEATRVYPGHGPSTSIGYEKKNNPFFR